jgi:hypothetical protein
MICKLWRLAMALWLSVVTSHVLRSQRIQTPIRNPVYSHSIAWQYQQSVKRVKLYNKIQFQRKLRYLVQVMVSAVNSSSVAFLERCSWNEALQNTYNPQFSSSRINLAYPWSVSNASVRIREVIGSTSCWDTYFPDWGFSQSCEENSGAISQLGRGVILPNPFSFTGILSFNFTYPSYCSCRYITKKEGGKYMEAICFAT